MVTAYPVVGTNSGDDGQHAQTPQTLQDKN